MLNDSGGIFKSIYEKNSKVFIDTCSLLFGDTIDEHKAIINGFFSDLSVYILKYKNKNPLIVPLKVCEEIQVHKEDYTDAILSQKATYTLCILKRMEKNNLVQFRGEKMILFQIIFFSMFFLNSDLIITWSSLLKMLNFLKIFLN